MVNEGDINGVEDGDAVYYEFDITNNYRERCLLGPDKMTMGKWNNKITQYDLLGDIVNVPPYVSYRSILDVIRNINRIKSEYKKFIIFESVGNSGDNCLVCDESTVVSDIYEKFKLSNGRFRISRFIPNTHSVSLHFVISGKGKFWISPIVDQLIENDILFRGGRYPSIISLSDENRVLEEASKIVDVLSKDFYLGLGNIDFMVSDGRVWFTEINPRKAGTTPCMSYMMENCFNYSIPLIEYYAVREGMIPDIRQTSKVIPWSLQLVKYDSQTPNIPGDERSAFASSNSTSVLYNEFYEKYSFRIDIND
jgi:hypothetical protein